MNDLDQIIRDMSVRSSSPIGLVDASSFFVGMKKMAEEGGQPQAGMVEGPFLVPLPQAVDLIGQMISNEFKTQVYYIFYANMLRGLSHHGLAEEFMEHAAHELEHATYLLRRISVLSPGGISIPPYAPPEPMSDPAQIVQQMIVVEQLGMSLWQQLHSIMGDSPMRFTIEQFMQREEEHQDELWQLSEAMQMPETPTAESMGMAGPQEEPAPTKPDPAKTQVKVETSAPQPEQEQKVAAMMAMVQRRKVASQKDHLLGALAIATKDGKTREAKKLQSELDTFGKQSAVANYDDIRNYAVRARAQANQIAKKMESAKVVTEPKFTGKVSTLLTLVQKHAFEDHTQDVTTPGAETPEGYMEREEQLAAQQAQAEAAHAKTVAMQASQAAQQAQAEAQAAQQQLQQAQQQVEQLSQENTQQSQSSLMATQQAAEAEARAAEHSISKMQLGMQFNQIRQQLANLVMQDPVAENAATVSDLAAQGMPATPTQQAQSEQQAAAGEGGAPPSAETSEQEQEAEDAQADAGEQAAQAEQSKEKDKAKADGTTVSVKTSGDAATVVRRAGSARGAVGAAAAPAASGLGALIAKAKPFAPHIAAGVAGAGLIGGGLALANRQKQAGFTDNIGRAAGRHAVEGAAERVGEAASKHAPALVGAAAGAMGLAAVHGSHKRQQNRADMTDAVAEGVRRAKTASPADQRMAKAVMGGEKDTLGRLLMGIIRKQMPQHAQMPPQQAVAGAAEAAGMPHINVEEELHALGDKIRPHLPGFAAGLGTGILGKKMLSRGDQQQMQPPAYYRQ